MLMNRTIKLWSKLKSINRSKLQSHFLVKPGRVCTEPLLIPENIELPNYTSLPIAYGQIKIKTKEQICKLRESCLIAKDVLNIAKSIVKPGVTTNFINQVVHQEIVKRGAYPSPLHYKGFPKSCCTSVNNVVCHGIPDDYVLNDGDIINIDITVYAHGYHGDTSDTFAVGNVDSAAVNLIQTTQKCLMLGIDACSPGQYFNVIGDIIEPYANQCGFEVCKEFIGHGIGVDFHELPNVFHTQTLLKSKETMKPGMVFTIEPILMEGSRKIRKLGDGWTVVSKDNCRSAQAEHTVLITSNGVEVLT